MALSIIARQTVTYYHMTARALNDVGQDVTTYASPVNMTGSFQPVPKRLYEVYGLDLQKSYYTFYTSNNLLDVQRDLSGDQIAFNNRRFQCESANDWFAIDGWKGVLCVDIGSSESFAHLFGFNVNSEYNFDNGNLS